MTARPFVVVAIVAELFAACSAREVPLFDVSPETAGRGGHATGVGQDAGGETAGAHDGTQGGNSGMPGGVGGADYEAQVGTAGLPGEVAGAGRPARGGSSSVAGSDDGARGGAAGLAAGAGGAAGQDAGVAPGTCASDADCFPSWLCRKTDCSAERGVCEPRDVFCDAEPRPVCGCDGTTYWNECIWRQRGTGFYVQGECGTEARPCNRREDCVPGVASCSRLMFQTESCLDSLDAGQFPSGVCWVTPPVCDNASRRDLWILCTQLVMPSPGAPTCVDTCTAIRSELPHYQARAEDACP